MRILFVCTGNTCRSPMAEGMMRRMAGERGLELEVQSAGVAAANGASISRHAETVLRDKGIEDRIISTALHGELVEWADLILTLTEGHKRHVQSAYPQAISKTYTLKEYAGSESGTANTSWGSYDISDPYGGSLEDYERTAAEIAAALDRLTEKLKGRS